MKEEDFTDWMRGKNGNELGARDNISTDNLGRGQEHFRGQSVPV